MNQTCNLVLGITIWPGFILSHLTCILLLSDLASISLLHTSSPLHSPISNFPPNFKNFNLHFQENEKTLDQPRKSIFCKIDVLMYNDESPRERELIVYFESEKGTWNWKLGFNHRAQDSNAFFQLFRLIYFSGIFFVFLRLIWLAFLFEWHKLENQTEKEKEKAVWWVGKMMKEMEILRESNQLSRRERKTGLKKNTSIWNYR